MATKKPTLKVAEPAVAPVITPADAPPVALPGVELPGYPGLRFVQGD